MRHCVVMGYTAQFDIDRPSYGYLSIFYSMSNEHAISRFSWLSEKMHFMFLRLCDYLLDITHQEMHFNKSNLSINKIIFFIIL